MRDPWGNPYVYNKTPVYLDIAENVTNEKSFDIYSKGADGATTEALPVDPTDPSDPKHASADDIIRASEGSYAGLGARF